MGNFRERSWHPWGAFIKICVVKVSEIKAGGYFIYLTAGCKVRRIINPEFPIQLFSSPMGGIEPDTWSRSPCYDQQTILLPASKSEVWPFSFQMLQFHFHREFSLPRVSNEKDNYRACCFGESMIKRD